MSPLLDPRDFPTTGDGKIAQDLALLRKRVDVVERSGGGGIRASGAGQVGDTGPMGPSGPGVYQPGTVFTAYLDGAEPGRAIVGGMQVAMLDGLGDVMVGYPTTTGLIETDVPGVYQVSLVAPGTLGSYSLSWNDPGGSAPTEVASVDFLVATGGGTYGLPAGTIITSAAVTTPIGYLLCDGAPYLRAAYLELFTALGGTGSTWGIPSGTEFNVPNLMGRTPVGAGAGALLTARTLGQVAGTESHSHFVAGVDHLHGHSLGIVSGASRGSPNGYAANAANESVAFTNHVHNIGGGIGAADRSLNSSTDGQGHMQPFTVVNFFIKAAAGADL